MEAKGMRKQDSAASRHPPVRSSAIALRRVSVQPTYYKRDLPYPAIEFSSPKGKSLFREALEGGTMEGFFRLMEQFQTQCETAFCGLATLSIILNALAIDPGRLWKGPWRWFDESLLDCCEPLETVKVKGITLPKLACLARCNGATAKLVYASTVTIDEFRAEVARCARGDGVHMAAAYARPALGQTGTGHFSPIGGYHAASDRVLILDVARFKYPPHWVPLKTMYAAIVEPDPETQKSRGYILLSARESRPGCLFTVTCQAPTWYSVARYVAQKFGTPQWAEGALVASRAPCAASTVVGEFLRGLPRDAQQFLSARQMVDGVEDIAGQLIEDVREAAMYDFVLETAGGAGASASAESSASSSDAAQDVSDAAVGQAVVNTLLCLLCPPALWVSAARLLFAGAPEAEVDAVVQALSQAADPAHLVRFAADEVRHLRSQVAELVCTNERCAPGHTCMTN
eukprot:Opistho-2@81690